MLLTPDTQTLNRILFIIFFHLSAITLFGQSDADYEERILNFHSDIVIESTGRVQVTEHIKVFANGVSIKRGIIRRIPVYREDVNGKEVRIDIRVLSVLRDGETENYHEENSNGSHFIYMGNKDRILDPGEYEYAITYESYGHVGFFDDYDELYWNVTGNDLDFVVEAASASVWLPDNSHAIKTACYTGYKGSTAQDCTYLINDSIVSFESDNSFERGEGFTIAVSFPRDIVKRPPPPSKAELLFQEYKKIGYIIISIFALGIFYFLTWRKVGRDPEKPVVIPTFNPPNGWSPAIVRYLYKKKYDEKAFTVAILSMAVKRALVISKIKSKYSLSKTNNTMKLSNEEMSVYGYLFSKYSQLTVSNKYHVTFSGAFTKLKNYLASGWNIKQYLKKNIGYTVLAALFTIVIIVAYSIIAASDDLFIFLFTSIFAVVGLSIFITGLRTGSGFAKIFMIIFGVFFAFPPLITGLSVILSSDIMSALFLIVLFLGFFLYMYLIKAPTQLGAQTQAELEGFKMYLETAEENRLNLLMPPELTPQLFEEMLPYAVALDVENKWSEKFNEVLAKYNYSPQWYDGDLSKFTYASFAGSLSSSFTSSFSSAKVDPTSSSSSSSGSSSWSSGSSGGGSSGGGGGGGGVSGW